jgi:polysaccharide export outer membrane protein
MRNTILLSTLFIAVILMGTGCFSSKPEDIKAFKMPEDVSVSADNYILQPPDEVEMRCLDVPELHLQSQRIRPDGMISFENVGEIKAAGKTPAQLAADIRSKLEGSLYDLTGDNPIDVRIVHYESKSYYVMGMVYSPGAKDYTGRETVLDAIAEAGLTQRSWKEKCQVIRPSSNPDVPPSIFEINLDRMMAHGDTTKNVILEEGDIVFVPPTILGAAGLIVEELFSPAATAARSVSIVTRQPTRR